MIDQLTGEVTVQTDMQEVEGTYNIQVIATVEVPDDYTKSSFTTLESLSSFELVVYVPCKRTEFDELILLDMATAVLGESDLQKFD